MKYDCNGVRCETCRKVMVDKCGCENVFPKKAASTTTVRSGGWGNDYWDEDEAYYSRYGSHTASYGRGEACSHCGESYTEYGKGTLCYKCKNEWTKVSKPCKVCEVPFLASATETTCSKCIGLDRKGFEQVSCESCGLTFYTINPEQDVYCGTICESM